MPDVLTTGLVLLAAYLLGSVSGSVVLGRWRGVDIRTLGSGNAGGTNAFRTQGAGFGAAVVLIDAGKGALVAWIALRHVPSSEAVGATAQAYAAVLAAAIGHVWPIWHGFRGGKGAATLAGGLVVLWPWVLPLALLAWMLVIALSGYVGLATLVTGAVLAAWAWLSDASLPRLVFAGVAALLLLLTHRGNLARMRDGTESRFQRARLLHRLWRSS